MAPKINFLASMVFPTWYVVVAFFFFLIKTTRSSFLFILEGSTLTNKQFKKIQKLSNKRDNKKHCVHPSWCVLTLQKNQLLEKSSWTSWMMLWIHQSIIFGNALIATVTLSESPYTSTQLKPFFNASSIPNFFFFGWINHYIKGTKVKESTAYHTSGYALVSHKRKR